MAEDSKLAKVTPSQKGITDVLSRVPPKKALHKAPTGNIYIPISFIEATLDRVFSPMGWQTKNFETETILNEVVGKIELWVKNPENGDWICRMGAAAQQIQMRAATVDGQGNKIPTDFSDPRNKIANALEKGFPSLKSKCISNAADSLGKIFGRDAGRKPDTVETYTAAEETRAHTAFLALCMEGQADIVALESAYNSLPYEVRADAVIINARTEYIQSAQKTLPANNTEKDPNKIF